MNYRDSPKEQLKKIYVQRLIKPDLLGPDVGRDHLTENQRINTEEFILFDFLRRYFFGTYQTTPSILTPETSV